MTAPAPMTPPDCDLRGYDYMPLFGHRLFRSHLYRLALRNPRAGLAAFKLWWEAWQQCPAGSLPDDDDDLAMLSDFGLDTKGWLKIRDIALHGFVKCSDGRLYHPIISNEAILAFERRKKERERKAANRKKKDGTQNGGGIPTDVPQDVPRDNSGTEAGTHRGATTASPAEGDGRGQDRTGQGEDRDKEREERASLRSDATASPDVRTWIFNEGLAAVRALTGLPDGRARGLVGKFLRDAGDDAAEVARVIAEAQSLRPIEPVAWMAKALAHLSRKNREPESLADRMRRAFAEPEPDLWQPPEHRPELLQ